MNRTPFLVASALTLMLASVPAFALGLSLGVGVTANVSASSHSSASSSESSTDANASGNISSDLQWGGDSVDLIGLVGAKVMSSAELASASQIGASTYDVNAWLNSDNRAAFDATIAAHADAIAELQAQIAANAALSAALQSHELDASDVVAASVTASGELVLYTHTNG